MVEKMKIEKMMMNMAMSIAEINNTDIVRMDLQRRIDPWYHLDVWYSDGKEITIRSDCTVWLKGEGEL